MRAENYLLAFENWLHDRKPAAQDLRASMLRDLVRGKVPLTVEEELAMAPRCEGCGGPILRSPKGKPGRYCPPCRRERARL